MPDVERDDLGALFSRITRLLISAEEPLLSAAGLTMWEYSVLTRLVDGPAPSQLSLARQIGHDKTRLIALLDGLQQRGLISRHPDPADRRSHLVSITPAGRKRHGTARTAIRAMEANFLAALDAREQSALPEMLSRLAGSREPDSIHPRQPQAPG